MAENEIICTAYAVKYHGIDEYGDYIVITQNRTKRRVPLGYYFEDTGTHIFVSSFYAGIFQHKNKVRRFILNKVTKEWRVADDITIEHHSPDTVTPVGDNEIDDLKKE